MDFQTRKPTSLYFRHHNVGQQHVALFKNIIGVEDISCPLLKSNKAHVH